MINRDYHIHTSYCDGRDKPEEMIKAAIEKGFETIGFTGHSPLQNESWCMSQTGAKEYFEEIESLKEKYKGKIEILCALEQDYYSDKLPFYESFDYVIGSVHCIETKDGLVSVDDTAQILKDAVDKHFGGDALSFAEKYFETASDVINKTKAQIVGHFDLLLKFNEKVPMFDTTHKRYIDARNRALEKLAKENVLFEVNTGAMSRGYRTTPYPEKATLKKLRELSADVILTSDCHNKTHLGYGFSEAYALLKECGFERIAYFSDGNIHFTEI